MVKGNTISLIIILFIIWIIFSGKGNYTLLSLGFLSILVVLYVSKKSFIVSELRLLDDIIIQKMPGFILYLFVEILKSNLHVIKAILTGSVNPQLIIVKNTTTTGCGQYILAIAITLTPGTLIIEYNKQEMLIHALDDTCKESLLSMGLNKAVARLERPLVKESP